MRVNDRPGPMNRESIQEPRVIGPVGYPLLVHHFLPIAALHSSMSWQSHCFRVAQASELMVAIFVESTIASQTAAAALLFSQVIDHGIAVAVQPEEMVNASLSVLTDLTQVGSP